MQMRKTYETTNKKQRAQQRKRAADQEHEAGFFGFGDVDAEEAVRLDPHFYDPPECGDQDTGEYPQSNTTH